jgi:hypothetical protein
MPVLAAVPKPLPRDPVGRPHRRLSRAGDRPRQGRDFMLVQKAVDDFSNEHPGLKVTKLKHDGIGNRQTIAMAELTAQLLGVDPHGRKDYGVSVYAQERIRNPNLRTRGEKERAKRAQERRREELDRQQMAARKPRIELAPPHDVVTGGLDFGDRVAAALLAAKDRYVAHPGEYFYSQIGTPDWDEPISAPSRGHRYDCSSFSAGIAGICGQTWVRNGGFFTGTALAILPHTSLNGLRPGGCVVFGSGVGHHMEMWLGDGSGEYTYAECVKKFGAAVAARTVGHGSAPVDIGSIWMMANPTFLNPLR